MRIPWPRRRGSLIRNRKSRLNYVNCLHRRLRVDESEQAFRRTDSIYESARIKLEGLDAKAQYVVVDIDAPETKKQFIGRELMETGLLVVVADQPGAVIITYKRR